MQINETKNFFFEKIKKPVPCHVATQYLNPETYSKNLIVGYKS